jgi:UPF0716 protein FxsA
MPHNEVMDGVMIVVGGTLLLTPGFITDVFGLLLLLPPTRAVIRRSIASSIQRRGAVTRVVFRTSPPGTPYPPPPRDSNRDLPRG